VHGFSHARVLVLVLVASGVAVPLRAQTDVGPQIVEADEASSSSISMPADSSLVPVLGAGQVIQPPAGPPPTPRHTGIKAMVNGVVGDFRHLPSSENLLWAAVGGGLSLAVHPLDNDVNSGLAASAEAGRVFKAGDILGQLPTLLASASVLYAVGRLKDEPKVSHVGMDLIQSLAMSEALTEALKYTTRRERPDLSGRNSFPSGHASDTFAFATALERHLGWRYAVPAYVFASYVAASRLPANRHWMSDTVFGSTVGIIAGRTVTSHEAAPFPIAVTSVPGGVAVMYVRLSQ